MTPDLTAQQLHGLMSPLWERCSELRPTRGKFGLRQIDGKHPCRAFAWINEQDSMLEVCSIGTATQLCESQMVRWLANIAGKWREGRDEGAHLIIIDDSIGWFVSVLPYNDDGKYDKMAECPNLDTGEAACPTLIQALAAACTAVLDAKAQAPA